MQTVRTTELKEGDVIHHYGVTFQLKNRKEYADGVIAFDTDCLVYTADAGFPYHWVADAGAHGYRIQGNARAYWNLLGEGA